MGLFKKFKNAAMLTGALTVATLTASQSNADIIVNVQGVVEESSAINAGIPFIFTARVDEDTPDALEFIDVVGIYTDPIETFLLTIGGGSDQIALTGSGGQIQFGTVSNSGSISFTPEDVSSIIGLPDGFETPNFIASFDNLNLNGDDGLANGLLALQEPGVTGTFSSSLPPTSASGPVINTIVVPSTVPEPSALPLLFAGAAVITTLRFRSSGTAPLSTRQFSASGTAPSAYEMT